MKNACSYRVFSGARWDIGGHMCHRPAKVQDNGKWYCRIHSPDYVAEKIRKMDERFNARQAAMDESLKQRKEQELRAAAYPRLVQALRVYLDLCPRMSDDDPMIAADLADACHNVHALLRELGELD